MNALVSFSVPPPQLNNNGILIRTVSAPPNPHSTKGIRSHHHHSPLAIFKEKAATVSFPFVLFVFLDHSQLFSPAHYQLNCYSVDGAAYPPSVDVGKNIRLPPFPASEFHGEGSDGEFASPFFSPTIPIFSNSFFFPIKLLFSWPRRPPSLSQ